MTLLLLIPIALLSYVWWDERESWIWIPIAIFAGLMLSSG